MKVWKYEDAKSILSEVLSLLAETNDEFDLIDKDELRQRIDHAYQRLNEIFSRIENGEVISATQTNMPQPIDDHGGYELDITQYLLYDLDDHSEWYNAIMNFENTTTDMSGETSPEDIVDAFSHMIQSAVRIHDPAVFVKIWVPIYGDITMNVPVIMNDKCVKEFMPAIMGGQFGVQPSEITLYNMAMFVHSVAELIHYSVPFGERYLMANAIVCATQALLIKEGNYRRLMQLVEDFYRSEEADDEDL